ncbi:YncE family protein [Streptomyces violarus]|uniref:YncE family protein n=1 Tax=Streptomyces violarus TaxID=67380 RepID=UPI0021C219B8|nr:YncE family protein [Streptomyces violarus]MCT9137761.1 YncE family protein [Streptomyces violarus]
MTRRSVIKAAGAGALASGVSASALGAARAAEAADVLVVVEKSSHAVGFYDVSSGRRLRTVGLPDYPHEMVVDSRRRFAYVGHYGVRMSSTVGEGGAAVFVIDLVERSLARTIDTRPFNRIHGMGIDRHDRLYALSEEKAVLLGFDTPSTDQAPTRAVPTHGVKTHLFTLSRDGERAYATGLLSHTVSLVRPHDASAPPLLATPGQLPESSCLSRDEKTLFVGARKSSSLVAMDARTLKVRRSRKIGGDPLRVYTLDDERLLVTDLVANTLTVFSTDLRPLRSLRLDGTPSAVSLHPGKPLAYVSQLGTNRVAVVDLDRLAVVGGFATQLEPDSSVLLPAP